MPSNFRGLVSEPFLRQFFLFCLLVGILPAFTVFADIITPSFSALDPLASTASSAVAVEQDSIIENGSLIVEQIGADSLLQKGAEGVQAVKENWLGRISRWYEQVSLNNLFGLLAGGIGWVLQTLFFGIPQMSVGAPLLGGLFLLLLIGIPFYEFRAQQKQRLLYLLPGLLLFLYLLGYENRIQALVPLVSSNVAEVLYHGWALVGLLFFVVRGKTRSVAFFGTLIVVCLLLGLPSAILFFLLVILLRIPYLTIKQNLEVFRTLEYKRLFAILLKSALYWSPLLLFVIPGNKLSNGIYESSIKGIYTHVFDRDDEERGLHKDTFVVDLNNFVDTKFAAIEGQQLTAIFEQTKSDVHLAFDGIAAEVGDQSDQLPKAIAKRYRIEMMKGITKAFPYLLPDDCGFHIIVPTDCCIMNGVKSYLMSKVMELGMAIGDYIEKDLAQAINAEGDNATQSLAEKKKIILERLDENEQYIRDQIARLKRTIKSSITTFYNGVILFNLIVNILFIILVIKSFLVVFARVAFSGREDIYVSLLEPDKRMGKGEIKKCGNQYTILSSTTKDFYTSRGYEPSGRPPKFVVPHKLSATVARMRTGNYALNHIVMRNRSGSVYFRALGGQEFVEWTLKPGEEVIFDLQHFVAMSETVKLGTTYSFRLTSLLLGRLKFTTAKGPGKLVLLTKGQPITSEERKGNASVPVSRIIAFQKNTRFHVHSELNFVDVFMSSIYLQKKPSDLIIIDADERGNAKSGISRFIKSFLLPI